MRINKYLPFAFIYFFVNSLFLPFGLTYTTLLAPLFYIWILLIRKKEVVLPFLAVLAPFILVQVLFVGVVRKEYFVSLLNIVLIYISCQAVYTFFKVCKDPETVFRKILVINFILCIAAIVLYFTPFVSWVWIRQYLTEGVVSFRRLKLFTYEASYYATLFVPIFCFYFLQYFFRQNKIKGWILSVMIFLPYLLSFSIGVMGSLFIAGILTYLIYFGRLTKKRRVFNGIVLGGSLSLVIIWPLLFFFNNNILFSRIVNFFSGRDTSGKGRLYDAYIIAQKLLREKNEYWGVGIGQIKIMGEDIIRSYYLYDMNYVISIPNAVAETWAIFGWVGVTLRIFIEIFLFFYTKVWMNYYRLWLFFFVFIYQFTGSFITNMAEYVIWILAFTNVFRQFDTRAQGDSKNP